MMKDGNKWLGKWLVPGALLMVAGIVLALIGQMSVGTMLLLVGAIEAAVVYFIWQWFL